MKREEASTLASTALDELTTALEQGKSEKLVEYLGMLSRFHQYSFRNCMLIALQRPDAMQVAGFNRWKELGRFVRKGERGIAILAPLVYRRQEDGEERRLNGDEKDRVLRGFKVVHVFDVSQTEGKPLPDIGKITGDPGENLSKLEAYVQTYGIRLSYGVPDDGALGVSRGGEIVIRPDLSPAETFSVLVHELAHELLHKGERRKETTKRVRETEAEAVAFVVSRAMGLEPGTRSTDYIQLFSGDKEVLEESLELIQAIADDIISALQTAEVEEVPYAA